MENVALYTESCAKGPVQMLARDGELLDKFVGSWHWRKQGKLGGVEDILCRAWSILGQQQQTGERKGHESCRPQLMWLGEISCKCKVSHLGF